MLLKILKKIFLEDPKIDEEMDADEKRKMYQAGPKPGANLTRANLANAWLPWADLIGADLTNANLYGAASCSVSVLLAPPLSAYS